MLSQKPLLSNPRISPTIVPLRNSQEKAPVRSDGWLLVSPTGVTWRGQDPVSLATQVQHLGAISFR